MPDAHLQPDASAPAARDGEAMTARTDVLLAAQSLFYVWRLGQAPRPDAAAQCWRAAFAAAGIAAAAGGAHHGLPRHRLPRLRRMLWKIVGLATGAAGLLLLVGGLLVSVRGAWRGVWVAAALVKSLFFGLNTWRRDDFRYVIYDYGSSMLALLMLQWWRPGPASRPIRRGVLLSFLAAALQQKGPVLHPRFDRNALYHLVQMVALHDFARAAQRVRHSARE